MIPPAVRSDAAPTGLRRLVRFLLLSVIAAGALALLVAGLVSYSTGVVDRLERQTEEGLVTRQVQVTLETITENVVSASVWNDAVEHTLAGDQAWMQLNYGDYYADYMGHEVTVAFDGADTPIYASRLSKPVAPGTQAAFIAAARPLIAAIREEDARRRGAGAARSGLGAVVTREGVIDVAGQPYFVAAATVIAEDTEHEPTVASPVVVSGRRVAGVVPQLGRELGLQAPRLVSGAPGGQGPVVTLLDPGGRAVGGLAWEPRRPGAKLLMQAVPGLMIGGAILLAALVAAGLYVHRLILSLARNEAALNRSVRAHDRVWRHSRDLLVILSPDGVIAACNPAWGDTLGQPPMEVVGRPIAAFAVPGDTTLEAAIAARAPQFDARLRHAAGSSRWISWRLKAEDDLIYAYGRDVTDEKAQAEALRLAQDALRQAQKLEAMGQLTGGVAHDFNNLLTPIIGSLDMLDRCEPGSPRAKRLIESAALAAERARVLVQRLLSFARRQPLQPTAIDVGALVRGMEGLLATTLGAQVTLSLAIEDELPPAVADANQVEMAILNLSVNARDAMPDGGTLAISAHRDRLDRRDGGLAAGQYVRLTVADTGLGMDEATMQRAVEPFFSTKGVGHGTGLGLSMVHGLALQLGGELRLSRREGGGTQVDLWLPASSGDTQAQTVQAADTAPTEPSPTPGLVMMVEDEEAVRASTAEMLSQLGYELLHAASAADALALLEAGARPEILLTDHMMPGMTGAELAQAARARWPQMPILLVSGFAEGHSVPADVVLLSKPFRQAELRIAIDAARQAVGSGARSRP